MVADFYHKFQASVQDMPVTEFILKRKQIYVETKQAKEVDTEVYQLCFWKTNKNTTIVRTVNHDFESDSHVFGIGTGKIYVLKGLYDYMTLSQAQNHYHFCYKYSTSIKMDHDSTIIYSVRIFDLLFNNYESGAINSCCWVFCTENVLTKIANDFKKEEEDIVEAVKKMGPISRFCKNGHELHIDNRVCRKCPDVENVENNAETLTKTETSPTNCESKIF